jgi:hypothetical protein
MAQAGKTATASQKVKLISTAGHIMSVLRAGCAKKLSIPDES